MKERAKQTQVYQLNFDFPQFQGQDKDLPDAEINVNFENLKDMESIFNCILNYITDDIKNTYTHTFEQH